VSSVTIAAPNPRVLAEFYQRLLGWNVTALEGPPADGPPEAGWAQLRSPSQGPGLLAINIEYDREFARPVWPSQRGKQTVTTHLDIPVDDVEKAVASAIEAGAVLADYQPQQHVRVMLDPAGHPFCLFLDA